MIAAAIGITPVSTEGQEFCASGTPICTRLETVKTKPFKAEKIKKESDKSDKSGRRNLSSNSSSESSISSESSDSSGSSDGSGGVIFDCGDAGLDQPCCFDICAAQDFTLKLEGQDIKRQARLERFDARIDLIQDPAK